MSDDLVARRHDVTVAHSPGAARLLRALLKRGLPRDDLHAGAALVAELDGPGHQRGDAQRDLERKAAA